MKASKAKLKALLAAIAASNPDGDAPAEFPMQDETFRRCSAAVGRLVRARQGLPLPLPSSLLPPLP